MFSMRSCLLGHLNPWFEMLGHKLSQMILSFYLIRKKTGTAVHTIYIFTVLKPRVLPQPSWLKLVVTARITRTCTQMRWRVRIWFCCQHTILVFPGKLVQVGMWLSRFTNITLNKSGSGRGTTTGIVINTFSDCIRVDVLVLVLSDAMYNLLH